MSFYLIRTGILKVSIDFRFPRLRSPSSHNYLLPIVTLQAEARAHRIGQKNPVTVYKLVSQGTVEEQMMGRIQKKLYLSAKVTEAMEDIHTKFGRIGAKGKKSATSDEDMPHLNTNQLMTLIRRGASAISKPQVDIHEMLNW